MSSFCDRIKAMRANLLSVTRAEFSKLFEIPEITLRSWESGKTIPSEPSVEKLLFHFQKNNVVVEKRWLVSGVGAKPYIPGHILFSNDVKPRTAFDDSDVRFIVPHDLYGPKFPKGSQVGGVLYSPPFDNNTIVLIGDKDASLMVMTLALDHKDRPILVPLPQDKTTCAMTDLTGLTLYKITWISF